MSRITAAQRLRSHPGAVVAMLGSVIAASAFAFAAPASGAASVSVDDSRAPAITGNINSCPNQDALVVGGTSSTTQNGITVTVTTLGSTIPNPFPAGGKTTIPAGKQVLTVTLPSGQTLIGNIYVKGGSGYNKYPGSALSSLIPPVNHGGQIAGLSHYLICGSLDGTQPTPTPTPTLTETITPTPTPTLTETITPTPTPSCTSEVFRAAVAIDECPTPTPTPTTPTPTPTPTCTPIGQQPAAAVAIEPCPTPTITPTTPTPTPTITPTTPTPTPTITPTTPTPTPTITPTTPTPTPTPQFGHLRIHKAVDKHTANYGDDLNYTLTVSATGQADEHNVVVTDVVPDKTTFVSATCDAPCTVSGPSGGVVTWTIGTMAVASSVELHMTVNIDKPSGDSAPKEIITNRAVASSTEHPEIPSNPVKTHVNQVLGEKVTRHHHHHHKHHVKAVHHHNPPTTAPSGSTLPFTGMPASSLGRFALVLVALGLVLEVLSRFRRVPARKRLH